MNTDTNQLVEHVAHGMRLIAARTSAVDVVRINGSILGGPNTLPKQQAAVAPLAAELLDSGTATRTKDQIRDSLAARGATLTFYAAGDRLLFSASCLPEDVSFVYTTIIECLTEAVLPAKELALAKTRALAEYEESKTDTRTQTHAAFSRSIYAPTHPNFIPTTAIQMKQVESVTRAELRALQARFGKHGLILITAGDIDSAKVLKEGARVFSRMPDGSLVAPSKSPNTKRAAASRTLVQIKDKANVDMYLGACVPITSFDARYEAFLVLLSLLGGRGFSGHFMQTIRERDGLTYGIYASLDGLTDGTDGAFRVWATFAPSVFEKGVAAILNEMQIFRAKPLSEKTLADKKSEMIGQFLVGLATTGGLAGTLHQIARDGRPLSYLTEFPERIRSLTAEEIIATDSLIPYTDLSLAAAGTFSA